MYTFKRRDRTRIRLLVIAITVSLLLFCSLPASWRFSTVLESVQLAEFMNSNPPVAPLSPAAGAKNKFNWSAVQFEHPPGPIRPLPTFPAKAPKAPRIQYPFKAASSSQARLRNSRRDTVRALFRKNWAAYREYAWGRDALLPLSAGAKDQFSGWAATLVDSLDTLWIMGMREEFDEAVQYVAENIDFGTSTADRVNTFETNIRYLGGLLAAYDLSGREVLLQKAVELGDLLYAAFNTPNRMPVDFIEFETAKAGKSLMVEDGVVSASPGTLSLELTHLSQVTGNSKYYDAAARVMDLFAAHQNDTLIPGLWPMMVSMRRLDVTTGNTFTIAGGADSLYEYLPKMAALLPPGPEQDRYAAMTRSFLNATDSALLYRPMLPGGEDILMAGTAYVDAEAVAVNLDPETEHLSCFIGGAYALAGRLFEQPSDVHLGEKLTQGCVYSYSSMPTGMGPERWNMAPCPSRSSCAWDKERWLVERQKRPEWKEGLPKGFTTAKDPRYILRPEAIESVFVLYRITGQNQYQDIAWNMFEAIANGTATDIANAAVMDVTAKTRPLLQEDYMEVGAPTDYFRDGWLTAYRAFGWRRL